jgi:Tfp pilus assembly protein PilE
VLRRLRSERGETFVELVVSAALLGILGVGMLTALSSTIIVSHADRGYAGTETVLRSYATTLERRPYKNCTAGSSANPYSASDLAFTAPSGYTTSLVSVKFLRRDSTFSGKDASDISASGAFSTTCPTAANGGDQGVQEFVIRASRNDGSAKQDARVLLRKGDS